MNGKAWSDEAQAVLERESGKLPAEDIARKIGFSVRTVQERQRLGGLPRYVHSRTWTRRDWLLASAAGLTIDFQIPSRSK